MKNILQENKIPYDKRWSPCGDYPAGREIFRIDADGEAIIKEFNANTDGTVALDDVIKALAQSN